MGLRMKNCIMGFTEKSDFQGVSKNQYIGGELAKKRRVVFLRGERVDTPMHTIYYLLVYDNAHVDVKYFIVIEFIVNIKM